MFLLLRTVGNFNVGIKNLFERQAKVFFLIQMFIMIIFNLFEVILSESSILFHMFCQIQLLFH